MDHFKNIESIIGQPEGQTLEYNAILPSSMILAQLICSFANSNAAFIILGVSKNLDINGLSPDFHTDTITNKALSLLFPKPNIYFKNISINGKRLFVIAIDKSEETIKLEGKKYVRFGAVTKLSDSTFLKFEPNGVIYHAKEKMMNKESFSYNEYDINLTSSYAELETQLKGINHSKTGLTTEEYLSRMKNGIDSYSCYHQLGSLDSQLPIILRYPAYNYCAHLAFQLMVFDINKIGSLLDFQHENYFGLDEFQKIVEHGVYNWVKQNSPYDNDLRLIKIMEWVDKRKGVDHKNNKLAKSIGNKILGKFKSINADIGEIVMIQDFQSIFQSCIPQEKKIFNYVFEGMCWDGFISYDKGEPNYVTLERKGVEMNNEEDEEKQNLGEKPILPIVVILTAIKEEYAAVRAHLVSESIELIKKDSILYEKGLFTHEGREIAHVIIKECGPRNPGTAQETQRAITNFQPQCILFVGIAGSRKPNDFGLGDVIFPENVHYYEGGKSEKKGFNPRSNDVQPTFTLCEIARIERHKSDWKKLIIGDIQNEVKADIGVMASGEQVVEHFNSDVGNILSKYYGDSACVAMEEYGFLNAITRQGVEFANILAGVVRGVSDIIENDSDTNSVHTNAQDRRPKDAKLLASNTASAFAYWLIIKAFERED